MTDADKLRDSFRRGFAGVFDAGQLRALAEACERDDPRLTNDGKTTFPPIMAGTKNHELPVEKCCAVAFALSGAAGTVGEVNTAFDRLVLWNGAPGRAAFLHSWDTLPRTVALPALALECRSLLAERSAAA